jgi:hypothetical protein
MNNSRQRQLDESFGHWNRGPGIAKLRIYSSIASLREIIAVWNRWWRNSLTHVPWVLNPFCSEQRFQHNHMFCRDQFHRKLRHWNRKRQKAQEEATLSATLVGKEWTQFVQGCSGHLTAKLSWKLGCVSTIYSGRLILILIHQGLLDSRLKTPAVWTNRAWEEPFRGDERVRSKNVFQEIWQASKCKREPLMSHDSTITDRLKDLRQWSTWLWICYEDQGNEEKNRTDRERKAKAHRFEEEHRDATKYRIWKVEIIIFKKASEGESAHRFRRLFRGSQLRGGGCAMIFQPMVSRTTSKQSYYGVAGVPGPAGTQWWLNHVARKSLVYIWWVLEVISLGRGSVATSPWETGFYPKRPSLCKGFQPTIAGEQDSER